MSAKARELAPGKWYLVIHSGGKRKEKLIQEGQEMAERLATEFNRRLKEQTFSLNDETPTVSDYAALWQMEIADAGLKLSTVNSYKYHLKQHINPALGKYHLGQLDYSILKRFVIQQKNKGYAKDSIRLMVATLRAMLNEAVTEGVIKVNPVMRLGKFYKTAKKLRDDPDPFSLPELHIVEEVCREHWSRYYPLVLTYSRTGVRFGEGIAIKVEDVDFENATIRIRANIPPHRQLETPKTPASNRVVDMSPQLAIVLQAMLARRKAEYFANGKPMPEWLFITEEENPPDYSNFAKAWTRIQKKAKVRRRRPHDLRHTYASVNLNAGKPLAYISKQLGHRSPNVTLAIYSRWIPNQDAGNRELMDVTANG